MRRSNDPDALLNEIQSFIDEAETEHDKSEEGVTYYTIQEVRSATECVDLVRDAYHKVCEELSEEQKKFEESEKDLKTAEEAKDDLEKENKSLQEEYDALELENQNLHKMIADLHSQMHLAE
jgi:chromosome segregation ATPase